MLPNAYCLLDELRVVGVKIDDLGITSSRLFRSSMHSWHVRETGSTVCTVFACLLSGNVKPSKALERNEVVEGGFGTVLEVSVAGISGVESFFRFSESCFTSIDKTLFSAMFALFVSFPPSSVSHIKLFSDTVASVSSWSPALSTSSSTFAIFAAIDLFHVVFGSDN